MPCLNEADTIGACVEKARRALSEHHIRGEIVVADNGSTDGSQQIATRLGARVVPVERKGYGSALMGGIEASRGKWIIMGDADDSYDFGEIPRFVKLLREGYDLVQGCRMPRGGGRIMPGAMPVLHRWWGNPMFSSLVRGMFNSKIDDVHCGMRGFTRTLYDRLSLRSPGMEFASEMVIKSSLQGERIAQVPITLYPDGRIAHPPHLRTFRDGWRHLRFMLMCSPRWLFVWPGLALILAGLVGFLLAMPRLTLLGATLDVHTLLFACLALLLGHQSICFGFFAARFAESEGLLPANPRAQRIARVFTLERGLIAGAAAIAVGATLLFGALNQWRVAAFGPLDYTYTMRWVIPGVTLTALGFQTVFASFFASILGLRRQ